MTWGPVQAQLLLQCSERCQLGPLPRMQSCHRDHQDVLENCRCPLEKERKQPSPFLQVHHEEQWEMALASLRNARDEKCIGWAPFP